MPSNEFYWSISNGMKLYVQEWNRVSLPRAVILLIHGLGEHSSRYQYVAEFFNYHNIPMMGFDLRGHGKSDGRRGHIDSYDQYNEDIDRLIDEARQRYPGLPQFLYGHSLGGNLVIYYSLKKKPEMAGLISTSPVMVPEKVPAVKLLLGKMMYTLMPTFSMDNSLDRTGLSRDTSVVDDYNKDPLVHARISARLGLDMMESGKWITQHASELTIPLLVMQGTADRLVSVKATRDFVHATRPDICEYRECQGGYHELHNDIIKEEVLNFMLAWIKARIN